MAKPGRPCALDHVKRREILAILAMGCSRRTAARYVGCSPKTIQNTADRDAEFAAELRRAEHVAEIEYLTRIRNAAKKEQYWRAAAWALERINPEDFAKRPAATLTADEITALLLQLADILLAELPVGEYRKRVVKSLDQLLARIDPASRRASGPRARDVPDESRGRSARRMCLNSRAETLPDESV